jgi:hypothetical protein
MGNREQELDELRNIVDELETLMNVSWTYSRKKKGATERSTKAYLERIDEAIKDGYMETARQKVINVLEAMKAEQEKRTSMRENIRHRAPIPISEEAWKDYKAKVRQALVRAKRFDPEVSQSRSPSAQRAPPPKRARAPTLPSVAESADVVIVPEDEEEIFKKYHDNAEDP